MIKRIVASALLIAALGTAQAADIIGSGSVSTQFRPMLDVQTVEVRGIGDLIVERTEGEQGLWIEAESNLHSFIQTSFQNGALRIWPDPDHNLHAIEPIRYLLKVNDIDRIHLSGNTSLETMTPYVTNHLRIEIDEAATAALDIDADEIDVTLKGTAQMRTRGRVGKQLVKASETALYSADDLISNSAHISVHDAANVQIDVSDDLDVTVDGEGKVAYRGTPTLHESVSEHASLITS